MLSQLPNNGTFVISKLYSVFFLMIGGMEIVKISRCYQISVIPHLYVDATSYIV